MMHPLLDAGFTSSPFSIPGLLQPLRAVVDWTHPPPTPAHRAGRVEDEGQGAAQVAIRKLGKREAERRLGMMG